mgnify:CR=1 FL=1
MTTFTYFKNIDGIYLKNLDNEAIVFVDGDEFDKNLKTNGFKSTFKEILNNISFEVYSGTLLSILGANGAGKTTLIKCINGILNFKKGEVLIDEKNFNNKSLKEKSKIMINFL